VAGTTASANVTVTQVSHDIYTDTQAQHNTEVEPDIFVFGSTIVSAFQVGRVFGGGASNIGWATSTDGGASWNSTVLVSSISHHTVAGPLREEPLPSAEADAAGTVYVTWADCRFRSGCPSNDIVLSKSTSETTWAAPTRVPIDPVTSTVDHFTPGIAVDRSTSGATARIGLTYYCYPAASCTASTCQLDAGFISSVNGGSTWSAAAQLAGPMTLSWLPNTSQGRMFGDYISTSVPAGGNAYPILPIANAPTGSTFDLAMYTPNGGLAVTGGTNHATSARRATATAPRFRPTIPLTAH
jgi:hypothetical protein